MPPLTLVHVVISLFAIAAGFVVMFGLLTANLLERCTRVFFALTLATSVTGFAFFPLQPLQPAHVVGIISLGVLAIALYALYGRHLAGKWRPAYVISVVLALYFNVFVLIVQSFMKIPALKALAPTQSEPPFAVAQVSLLAGLALVTARALMRFHPAAAAERSSLIAQGGLLLSVVTLSLLTARCAATAPPLASTEAATSSQDLSGAYRDAAARRRPEDPNLVWTPANVALISQRIAPGVFAVYPDDAARKNAEGVPVATSGGFIVGTRGVLLVDTMINRELAGQLLALVREQTDRPILYAVNTSYHGDHSYGNQFLPEAAKVVQHAKTQAYVQANFAKDVAFMTQYFGAQSGLQELVPHPADLLVGDGETLDIDLGDKLVKVAHLGFAQTDGDLFVSVPADKVLFTGNPIISSGPSLPWLLDGHHAEALATLQRLRNLFPRDVTIVPGHGVPTDMATIARYIVYLQELEREVIAAIDARLDASQTAERVGQRMQARYGGYKIYPWVHTQVNVGKVYEALRQQPRSMSSVSPAEPIVVNARVTTLDKTQPEATALAAAGGRIVGRFLQ